MAYLTKCPLCGRQVSSECKVCPNCGHNVAQELQQKENDRKEKLIKQGICPKCGSNRLKKYHIDTTDFGSELVSTYSKQCANCDNWEDFFHGEREYVSTKKTSRW